MANKCSCIFRVKLGKREYQCVQCGAVYGQPLNGNVHQAPPNWGKMDAKARALWAAREMLGAQL